MKTPLEIGSTFNIAKRGDFVKKNAFILPQNAKM
jgi:hypothetical protein